MRTLRVFVGVPVDAAVAARISAVRTDFGAGAVRWIPTENYHLTLKFLGDVEEPRIAAIRAALRETLVGTACFRVTARGLGVFPDARRPRVLWVGLAAPELTRVAGRVERGLEALGFERATAPFRPHVTIGRWRRGGSGGVPVREELPRWRDHDFGEFAVDAATLFRSTLRPDGAVYDPLEVFPLDKVNHKASR